MKYRQNREVFFMHLHKAAGTTICNLAVANGLRAAGMHTNSKLGYNCNIKGDDPGHLGLGVLGHESPYHQSEGNFTCEDRLDFMNAHKIHFVAIERWIFPHEICLESFIYVTVLRDPIKRIESAVKYHTHQTEALVIRWATTHIFIPQSPISTGSSSVDNFYVRSFGGKDTFMKTLGSLTNDDYERAIEVLDKFEVILILETYNQDKVQLRKYLDWNSLVIPNAKTSKRQKRCNFKPNQRNTLINLNVLDYDFYKHAQKLAANRTKFAKLNPQLLNSQPGTTTSNVDDAR